VKPLVADVLVVLVQVPELTNELPVLVVIIAHLNGLLLHLLLTMMCLCDERVQAFLLVLAGTVPHG